MLARDAVLLRLRLDRREAQFDGAETISVNDAPQAKPMSRPIYEELTRQIIAALKEGHLPWIRPWNAWPLRHNGRHFTGTNSLILCMAADEADYGSRYWLTEAQGKRYGARVAQGQNGTSVLRPVIVPLPAAALDPAVGVLPTGTRRVWKTRDGESIRVRTERYQVFNAEQFIGLPTRFYAAPERDEPDLQRAEQFFGAIGARIDEAGDRASYCPTEDLIRMPRSVWFHGGVGYYATLAHELGHWTGHGTRLARDFKGQFGDPDYAKEELVAELTAAYVLAANGLPGIERDRHAAYLDGWLKVLEDDPEAFPKAADLGQRAADYLTIAAAAPRAAELAARPLDARDYVTIYLDRVEVGPNPVLVAIGVDAAGFRALLGVGHAAQTQDASKEEKHARTLLVNLVNRGLPSDRPRLFVTSHPTRLKNTIRIVFGETSRLQRCRSTVVHEVVSALRADDGSDRFPGSERGPDAGEGLGSDVLRERIRDAFALGESAGREDLGKLVGHLENEGARSAARTLRNAFPHLFTVDHLGLEPQRSHTLSTAHVVSQARFGLPGQICRPPTWRDEGMALHWSAASFADTVEGRRRIPGYRQLRRLVAGLQK